MFSTPAYAQNALASSSATNDMLIQFVLFGLIIGVFYVLMIRPQQMQAKQQKTMRDNLQRGDEIETAGGLIGKVHRVVSDEEVIVELGEATRVRVVRSTIASVRPPGGSTPAADDKPVPRKTTSADKER